MRIGINLPTYDADGLPLDIAGLSQRAQWIEAAGLDAAWALDGSMRFSQMTPDPLMWLLVACAATEHIEVITGIYQIPLRQPIDLAQRFMTLQGLTHGRFSVGVGAGSEAAGHEGFGVAFEDRFRLLHEHMDTIRRLCNGEVVGPTNLGPWPSAMGGPPFMIGAWYSDVSLKRAATQYDGWLSSGGKTTVAVISEAIKRYRGYGGKRAVVSTVSVDLGATTSGLADDEPFNLECDPATAAERLNHLEELGYDDVLLMVRDSRRPEAGRDFTLENLQEIRALVPPDTRKPYGS